jgi:excisionase family DNA binding protein
MTDLLLSVEEIADRVGCSVRTVRRWIADGALDSVKVGGLRRVTAASLDRFIGVERTDWDALAADAEAAWSRTEEQNDPWEASND